MFCDSRTGLVMLKVDVGAMPSSMIRLSEMGIDNNSLFIVYMRDAAACRL